MAERTCIGCRQSQPQEELIRFVLDPAGGLVIDYRRRLPGRGAYTCIDRECMALAISKKAFARAFRTEMLSPDLNTLLLELNGLLQQRILNLIGMARKSRSLVSGSNTVLQELGRSDARLLIVAIDAAAGTADKIVQKAQGHNVPWVRMFDKEILGRAVGRDERSHIVITDVAFAKNLALEMNRLSKIAGET